LRTRSIEVDVVVHIGVAVLTRELPGVFFQGGRGERDRIAAPSTQQVVAVLGPEAQPVESLAILGALCFSDALVGQGMKDAVDGRQRNPGRLLLMHLEVELLGAAEIVAPAQGLEDSLAFDGASTSLSCGWGRHLCAPLPSIPISLGGAPHIIVTAQ
jgi:hypothetical protein